MNWFFRDELGKSSFFILTFELANLMSGIILLMTTAVLCYFIWKKRRGISDPCMYIITIAICFLGMKKLITMSLQKWAAYPVYCTLIDLVFTVALVILIWLLPPLILRILATVSRDELLQDLVVETRSKLIAQESLKNLEIRNSQLQAIIFRIDSILSIGHRIGNQTDTVARVREAISSSGGASHGE